ncbi:MAG: alpha/beta fold hydrolase [Cyclobacteriaceae bacterium]
MLNHRIIGEGQPLVILHGLFGSLDNWLTLSKRFAENYQVVLVDQRNHGKSFHADDFNYSEMSDDLQNLIDHLALERPILLGHSMGGKTVMQYAAFHPESVDKLIVADIGPKPYPVHHELIIEGLKSVDFSMMQKREEIDMALEKHIPDFGTRSFLMKNVKRTSEGGFDWKMNLIAISKNIEEVGKPLDYFLPIETPTMFIRGGASNYIKDDDFDDISEIFPEVIFETVAGSGHWLHADNPEAFYQKVATFLL